MAWWTTQFIFRGDVLIAEGFDPPFLYAVEWVVHNPEDELPDNTETYTRVIASGYALYGELRGYYALGVAHWRLDQASNCAFISEASRRNTEPVSSLTLTQRAIIRECLVRFNSEAWESSNISFRQQLEN